MPWPWRRRWSPAGRGNRYRSAALLGVEATGARSGKLMGKHNALAHRLIDRQDDYLRFTRDPRVPFDNNGRRGRSG
jgi:hypothetical protein